MLENDTIERFIVIEHDEGAYSINQEAARVAQGLVPEYPWPTDEPFPNEAFYAVVVAAPHRRYGLDPETLPLFEEWMALIESLHDGYVRAG